MPAAPARGGSASKPSLTRVLPMRGSKSAHTVCRPPARCFGRTQMCRSDIPSTTVTPPRPQRPLPRMGASCLRAQEPQLMRSPGEPLQLNQHPFGSMIELAVIGHRPRARSSSDASRGSVEITILPRTSSDSCLRYYLSPRRFGIATVRAILLEAPATARPSSASRMRRCRSRLGMVRRTSCISVPAISAKAF